MPASFSFRVLAHEGDVMETMYLLVFGSHLAFQRTQAQKSARLS